MDQSEHTFSQECLACGDYEYKADCVHRRYGARRRAFYRVDEHRQELAAAAYAPTRRTSEDVMLYHAAELDDMPYGHNCMCHCPRENVGYPTCPECKRFRSRQQKLEGTHSQKHGKLHAPMPNVLALDYAAGFLR